MLETTKAKGFEMRQRTAMLVAMGLTAFVLVIAIGVATRLAVAPATTTAVESTPLATVEPTVQDSAEERAAAYQQALQTANARLEQANRQLQDAYQRLTAQAVSNSVAVPGSAPAASDASALPAGTQISEVQAAVAALAYVGGGTVERVSLEEEQGQLVYVVRFTDKSRVYVDPAGGQVIYAQLEHEDGGHESDDSGGHDD